MWVGSPEAWSGRLPEVAQRAAPTGGRAGPCRGPALGFSALEPFSSPGACKIDTASLRFSDTRSSFTWCCSCRGKCPSPWLSLKPVTKWGSSIQLVGSWRRGAGAPLWFPFGSSSAGPRPPGPRTQRRKGRSVSVAEIQAGRKCRAEAGSSSLLAARCPSLPITPPSPSV